MMHLPEKILPADIERRSFEIITEELGERAAALPAEIAPVVKRVIHTTADFSYYDTLCFSENVVLRLREAIRAGACIVTDTEMAKAGINKRRLQQYGGEVFCFMSDASVAAEAKERGVTRACVSMEHAAALGKPMIFAVGNAPTALISLYELLQKGFRPLGIIGVPVGFVNVVEAKELILSQTEVPYIVARGRKGGSNVAAAIVNAILYGLS